jgi:MORN repeat variant
VLPPKYYSFPDSVISIKAIDSSKVYEMGKACVNCTVFVNGDGNLILKEYFFEKGEAVRYTLYNYGKKQKLDSVLTYSHGKLVERRKEYGKDVHEYKNTFFYDNGRIKEEGPLKRAYKNGVWTEYYENGKVKTLTTYELDKKTGKYKEYSENGKIRWDGYYTEDQKTGYWAEYNTTGAFIKAQQHQFIYTFTDSTEGIFILNAVDNRTLKKIKPGDHIAIERFGGTSIPDGLLKAVKNDTVYACALKFLDVEGEVLKIPVSQIVSVGYISVGGTLLNRAANNNLGGVLLNAVNGTSNRDYNIIRMEDKKYIVKIQGKK